AADYLIVNETEAEVMSGRPARSPAQLEDCVRQLLGSGFRRVVLTLGAKGALLAYAGERVHLPPFPVRAVDTTGGGRCVHRQPGDVPRRGLAEHEAVRRANLYAALSATRVGTQKSFARRDEFEAELARRQAGRGGPTAMICLT
ncbi:ribokinase, partial [mine drainage metagenome]